MIAAAWVTLDEIASAQGVELRRRHGGVEVWPADGYGPLFVIHPSHHLDDNDADLIVRRSLLAALAALKALPR